ncbi:MAG: amidase [Actinobacteria bacterium]|jgi:amidase|nr:amidase [Actinomycetota bacterium]
MADNTLIYSTALEIAEAIRNRQVSPLEVMESVLARMDAVNPKINAVIWRNDEEALANAKAATDTVARSHPEDLPPFHGVPIPIKDLSKVKGWPITYGSWAAPEGLSQESELIVESFQRAGFILTGRTNTPEFGPIPAAENDRYGITRNPWNLDITPGGSSGGAASATAAGVFPVAHGNDGGGSIRIPASCCGLVGLKVSRGRIPTLVTYWEGGAVEGVLTSDVASTAAILDVTCGPDRGQWYNAPDPARPFRFEVGADPGKLRIGLLEETPLGLPMDPACTEAAREAATALERLGHHIEPASLDITADFIPALLNVLNSGLADYDADWDKAEPHVRANRVAAQAVDSLTYVRSVHTLQQLTRDMMAPWGADFDVLLTPTMTIQPPRAGDILEAVHTGAESGAPALQVFQMAVLTAGFNMTGQPAISLPTHMAADGTPIGIQLVSGPWDEALLIRLASQLEIELPWAHRRPPL